MLTHEELLVWFLEELLLDKYYLFGNIIYPKANSTNYPSDLDVYNSYAIYEFINSGIKDSCNSKSHESLASFINSIDLLVDSMRGSECKNGFMIYHQFYMTITTVDYHMDEFGFDLDVLQFLKDHDFTSVYYNYAYLFASYGNTYDYLYYLTLADAEYASKNDSDKGAFISFLIRSKNYSLWNLIPNILCDYQNYETANGHVNEFINMLELYNISIDEDVVGNLIQDFKYDLLLQFIYVMKSVSSINNGTNFRASHNSYGEYKAIRATRFIGELAWIFEVYIKDKLTDRFPGEKFEEPLDKTIRSFLGKMGKEYQTTYSQMSTDLHNKFPKNVNTQGLLYLITKMSSSELSYPNCLVTYMLALKTFRNYYSHYMDRHTNLGAGYYKSLPLKLAIYNSFLIVKQVIDSNFELNWLDTSHNIVSASGQNRCASRAVEEGL